jgi:hypothetical protein
MKKHILLAVAVCSAFILKAGDKDLLSHGGGGDSKLTIGLSVGAALPMSAYGAKATDTASSTQNDSTHVQNGFASTGFHFDVTASYMFADHIGGQVMIGGNMNSFDVATYKTVNNIKSPETFTANNYYIGQYLVGPVLSFGDKLKLNIRVLVGLVTSNATVITETNGQSGGAEASFTRTGNPGSGFGYNFGAGIKYNFNDKMGLLVNVDYLGSTLSYTGYGQSSTFFGTTSSTTNTTLKQTMALGMVNASVGIAFNL